MKFGMYSGTPPRHTTDPLYNRGARTHYTTVALLYDRAWGSYCESGGRIVSLAVVLWAPFQEFVSKDLIFVGSHFNYNFHLRNFQRTGRIVSLAVV